MQSVPDLFGSLAVDLQRCAGVLEELQRHRAQLPEREYERIRVRAVEIIRRGYGLASRLLAVDPRVRKAAEKDKY